MFGRLYKWLFSVPVEVREVPVVKEVIREVVKEVTVPSEPKVEEDTAVFKVESLKIYTYFDGSKEVKADPMVIYKRWAEKSGDLDVDLKIARSGMKGADEAYEKALEKVRWIFDVKPLADGGLDEQTTLELFFHFLRYIEAVKKNSSTSPTSSPTSASPPEASSAGT